MAILCIVSVQYFVIGYSLCFSFGNGFIGSLTNIGMRNVMASPSFASAREPDILYAVYELTFAAVTPAIAFGAAAGRGSLSGVFVLTVLWSTIVYDPIAHAVWQSNGFLFKLGDLDFAGGGEKRKLPFF
jgi:Amt family ammonium transporter